MIDLDTTLFSYSVRFNDSKEYKVRYMVTRNIAGLGVVLDVSLGTIGSIPNTDFAYLTIKA